MSIKPISDEKKYIEIKRIKWFSKCKKNIPDDIGYYFKVVNDWKTALLLNFQDNWQEINMNENHKLITILGDDPDYENCFDEYAMFFTNQILPLVQEYTIKNSIDFSISTYVRWVVINSLLENHYQEKYKLPLFHQNLLEVYKSGHFPCGWDGNYPDGFLYIL